MNTFLQNAIVANFVIILHNKKLYNTKSVDISPYLKLYVNKIKNQSKNTLTKNLTN